ncbi:hypothetical protein [Vulcaniibacterium gelatinicum]|uniref:hypothetical protein n=1 Tax=Vulcaniibacterium gelatinicum TaxID=2598725 RepID=UPI0011CAD177|nr:hypothetical protein [Vulcaniibacterium gelatinicum]
MPRFRRHPLSVLSALLVLGCAAARPADAPPAAADPLERLPELPAIAWPAPFALERAMGAECTDPNQPVWKSADSRVLSHELCEGPMPRHMARAWRAIAPLLPWAPPVPGDGSFARVIYRVVPGFGARADVVVDLGTWREYLILRSFEGRQPGDTVYAVWTHFCEYSQSDCPEAAYGRRVFRLDAGGQARDVTAEVMPPAPRPDALDLRMLEEHTGSGPYEIISKLGDVPTTRWIAEYDPENPPPDSYPRFVPREGYAHFGFVVWNGQRFELRERVARALWPCAPDYYNYGLCRNPDDLRPGSPWIEEDNAASKDE